MRNLKRALSLTLASVMLLGMMVVGSSAAAGYDDVKETDNVEAIEVLQTVGVMVGDERGFGPDRPVNRAEMAVVMGLLLNLDYNYYTATCPFNDVYDWARGWVGACAANGIVSGRGDGVYDPGATVTAVEGASMLMRALGYFKYASDYADGFEVSTVRQGTTIGIFDGVGSSATEPMTRNQVAQMVLNTLKSGMVQPDGNTLNYFDNNGNIIATGGKINYVYVTSNKAFARSISSVAATSMGSTNDAPIVELGEQLYNGELKLYDKQVDDFNRPSRIWEYQGNEIGTYVKKELLKQEYTVKVTGQTLYELLTKNTIDTYRFEIAVDGVQYDDAKGAAVLKDAGSYFDKTDLYRTNKDGVGGTGKGVLTQVFVDTDYTDPSLYTVYISVINTYLAKANEDYDAKDDDVRLDVFAIADDVQTRVYAKKNPNNKDTIVETITVDGDDFDIKDVKEDDLFLVTVADSAIQTMVAPEIVSDTVINAFSQRDWINLSGTQYDYASTARYDVDVLYQYDNPNLKDVTYNVILDKYGYAIGLEKNEDPDQYVFLTGIEQGYSNLATRMVDANVIHLDGTMKTVKVDTKKSTLATFAEPSQANTWCVYRADSDGVYTLTQVAMSPRPTTDKAAQWKTNVTGDDETVIDQKHISLPSYSTKDDGTVDYSAAAKSVTYGDDKTVYLNVELDNIPAKDYQGKNQNRRIIDDVTSVVTGHRNVKISVKNCPDATEDDKIYAAPAEEIYTLYNDKNYIIAVVTIGEDEGVSSNWAYVTSSEVKSEAYNGNTTKADNDGKWTWSREVIIDGKKTEIKYVDENLDYIGATYGTHRMNQGEWYEIKYAADGTVRSTERLLTKLADSNVDDGYVQDIKDVRTAVTKKDNVLLQDLALPAAIKFDEQGTLYTEDDITKGFAVSPDVKVVLALGSKLKSDKTVAPFDTVDDCDVYTGYTGLRNALKDMNVMYLGRTPTASDWGKVELNAVLVNNSATVIVIRDDNPAPDNKNTSGGDTTTTGKITAATGTDIAKDSIGGDLSTTRLGKVNLNVTFKAPEWAAGANDETQVTFDVTIRDNVDVVLKLNDTNFGTESLTSGTYSFTATTGLGNLETAIEKGLIDASQLKAEVSNVKWTNAVVKYFRAVDNTEVDAAALTTPNTKLTTASTGETLKIQYTLANDTKYEADGQLTYKVENATKVTGELSGDLTTGGLTSVNAAAEGGKVVKVTIGGIKLKTTTPVVEKTISVAPSVKDTLVFAVLDNEPTTAADINGIAADKWQSAPVTAAASKWVVVKNTVSGINLTGVTLNNKNYETNPSAPTASTVVTGVYKFQMPGTPVDLVVSATANDSVTVEKGYVYNNSSDDILNLRLESGNPALAAGTTAEKAKTAQVAKTWLESKGYTVTITETLGVVTGVKATKGSESYNIEIANITGTDTLGYATVKTADGSVNIEVVNSAAWNSDKYSAVLALLGIDKMEDATAGSSTRKVFVTPNGSTDAVVKSVKDDTVTNGDTIDIGKMIDTDTATGYVELTFAVTGETGNYIGDGSAADSEAITGLAAEITTHDGVKYAGSKLYVMGDEGVTITIGITCTLPDGKGSKAGLKATVTVGDATNNKLDPVSGSALSKNIIAASTTAVTADKDCSTTIQITITPQNTKHIADDTITVTFVAI